MVIDMHRHAFIDSINENQKGQTVRNGLYSFPPPLPFMRISEVDKVDIQALDEAVLAKGMGCELQKVDHVHQTTADSWSSTVVLGMPFHLPLVKDTVVSAELAGVEILR